MNTAQTFDYIIVGAGSAGCVLAARLSENPETRVLLLEAGGSDDKKEIRIPAAFPKLFKSDCDWNYSTEPQPHLSDRRLYWPRGKVLGGSGSINAMIYIRGHHLDYDDWAAQGNPGWSFSDVLPYFKKAERQETILSEFHSSAGMLNVTSLTSPHILSEAFLDACAEMGIPLNNDFNGASQEGAGFYQVTQKKGQRYSPADAYLKPAFSRSNLTVYTRAQVRKLLLHERRVTGIEFQREQKIYQTTAAREVILCGGAINSPQLLMLSGIGPADQLNGLGIPVIVHLPGVGQNLQDHLLVALACECTQPITMASAGSIGNVLWYLLFKKGMLTSNVAEAGAFIRTSPKMSAPDLQLLFGPTYYFSHGFDNPPGHGFGAVAVLLTPESRGHVRLRDADPLSAPLIHPNYLERQADLQTLITGVKLVRRIQNAAAFNDYRGKEIRPGTDVQSDEAIAEFIRRTAETIYHPTGTCRMGRDVMAVVDNQLRVHGIEGLRVVDASIMPSIPRGNTNAPTIMIAEKAADLIRGEK